MISELDVRNFKSFGSSANPLFLGNLNFLVGANASGKTNLVSALKFLQSALLQNIEVAVAEFDGLSEIRNKNQRERKTPKPITIRVRMGELGKIALPSLTGKGSRTAIAESCDYTIELSTRSVVGDEPHLPVIKSERLMAIFVENDMRLEYKMERDQDQMRFTDPIFGSPKDPVKIQGKDKTRLAAAASFFSLPLLYFRSRLEEWSFFNIDPDIARKPSKVSADITIGAHGESLASILYKLEHTRDSNELQKIADCLEGVVPGFRGIKTRIMQMGGGIGFQVQEGKLSSPINPRSVSDGTIRLIALAVILNWAAKRSSLVTIEEPENGLHPHLSEHLVSLLRETSEHTQLIVTTHNPRFLDYLEPEELFLCDKVDGMTTIRQASRLEDVKMFQKNFTLGERWIQGQLGGIP
jgi:predicted ATPase